MPADALPQPPMCTHAGVVSRAECPWCEIERLNAELKRIGEDKDYLFRADVGNDWEERLQVQAREIENLRLDTRRLNEVILNGWRLVRLSDHKDGAWHVWGEQGQYGPTFGVAQTPREAIDAAIAIPVAGGLRASTERAE